MRYWFAGVLALGVGFKAGLSGQSIPDRDIIYSAQPAGLGTGFLIWRLGPDGSDPRPITAASDVGDNMPVWSPDGREIAFVSNRDDPSVPGIYVMNADGSNIRAVGPREWSFLTYPEWSPDGREILFSAGNSYLGLNLYVMNADGTRVNQLTSGPASDYCAQWEPDGSRIVFSSNRADAARLMVLDRSSGRAEPILPDGFDADCADWAPDGARIAFSSPPDHQIPALDQRVNWTPVLEIYVLDLDTGAVDQLTHYGSMSVHPRWSRDGRRIVFNSTRDFGTAVSSDPTLQSWVEIYTMNGDGSDVRRLTDNGVFDGHPSW